MSEAESIYASIPGGPELLAWFGRVPFFHDAEIVSLSLHRRSASTLVLHTWNTTAKVDDRGYLVLDRHAVVTFALEDIVDLQLDGFSGQNVIFGLRLSHQPERLDRPRVNFLTSSPNDYEIELEPCYGLNGRLRCRRVSVSFVPGKPGDLPV